MVSLWRVEVAGRDGAARRPRPGGLGAGRAVAAFLPPLMRQVPRLRDTGHLSPSTP